MPLTKRFKDAFQSYQTLQTDFKNAQQILTSAQATYIKAKKAMDEKTQDILKELDANAPVSLFCPERVVDVGGKIYLINNSPKDVNTDNPSYIREVTVERC